MSRLFGLAPVQPAHPVPTQQQTTELATLLDRTWETGFLAPDGASFATAVGEELGAHDEACCPYDVDADCEDEHDLASQDEAEIRALDRAYGGQHRSSAGRRRR